MGKIKVQLPAVLVAVALHLALYWLALPTEGRPTLDSWVDEPTGAMSVSLVGPSFEVISGSTAAARTKVIEALGRRLAAGEGGEDPAEQASQTGDLDALFGPQESIATRSTATGRSEALTQGPEGTGRARDPRDQVSLARPSGRGVCWRRPAERLSVKMTIMVDDDGGLVGVPRVTRSGNALAEAQAWRAMAGCAPYAAAKAGRYRTLELDFGAGEAWTRPGKFVEIR